MRTKLTNDQINRKMAEIAGLQVIESSFVSGDWELVVGLAKDGKTLCTEPLPDYASDLNLVHKEELKLVKMGLGIDYFVNLQSEIHKSKGRDILLNTAIADAKTRCLAIIKTWDSTQVEKERNDNTRED